MKSIMAITTATMVAMSKSIIARMLILAIEIERVAIEIEIGEIEIEVIEIELKAIGVREKARNGARVRVRVADLEIVPGTDLVMVLEKSLEAVRTDLGHRPASAPRPNLNDLLRGKDQANLDSNPEEGPPSQALSAVTGGGVIKVSIVIEENRVDHPWEEATGVAAGQV